MQFEILGEVTALKEKERPVPVVIREGTAWKRPQKPVPLTIVPGSVLDLSDLAAPSARASFQRKSWLRSVSRWAA